MSSTVQVSHNHRVGRELRNKQFLHIHPLSPLQGCVKMLRKRTRSHQKVQQNMGQLHNESCYSNPDVLLKQKHKANSFFTVPGLFVGLNPKNLEPDSVRSPTSPLDFKISPKPNEGTQKSWDCNKVGLSMIESFEGETKPESSDSKSILFGPQMRIFNNPSLNPVGFDNESLSNSLPKNYAILEKSNPKLIDPLGQEPCAKFWSHSLDSTNLGSNPTRLTNLNPGRDLVASLSASEIELSEDYTCVRKHGPNPKTTHIFGDCILERHNNEFIAKSFKHEIKPFEVVNSYPSDDFLSFCYSCKKKLAGEDIYMYRGEKAFCSWNCRSEEISIEEEMEKNNWEAGSSSKTEIMQKPDSCEELFETSMFIAT